MDQAGIKAGAFAHGRFARGETAWLSHLELLAELPYSGRVLMPSVLAAVRAGFKAELGFFFWVEGANLTPVALWGERTSGAILDILRTRLPEVFADFPLRLQWETDGDLIRTLQSQPGDEERWVYAEGLHPLGVHWGLSVPLRNPQGDCVGFLYIYRAKDDGPYSDADNLRLKRARDRLIHLGSRTPHGLPPCPYRFRHAAHFHFDTAGRMLARSARGVEVLYQYQDLGEGLLNWDADDLSALPAQARGLVRNQLDDMLRGVPVRPTAYGVDLPAGRFDFHAEPMMQTGKADPVVAVRVSHYEPLDVALARALLGAPFSLQEKRVLVASARQPSLQELAGSLGITVGTLKHYINRMQTRTGLPSRQAIIERLLDAAHPGAA